MVHQEVSMTVTEYHDFYSSDEYHAAHQSKISLRPYEERYQHDLDVAGLRLQKYDRWLPKGGRILDLGPGRGAWAGAGRQEG